MSEEIPTREKSTPSTNGATNASTPLKHQRVLACISCQHRKIKCDRKFPCANCNRAGTQCIPAAVLPRQRRRRFPERELLERLRHYETLLRQNKIKFEPLHALTASDVDGGDDDSGEERHAKDHAGSRVSAKDGQSTKSMPTHEPKNIWDAMNQKHASSATVEPLEYEDDDDDEDDSILREEVTEVRVKKQVEKMYDSTAANHDHLLFGSPAANFDLYTLHPTQVHIFRLWQLYLDNVNPLFKVTHTPSLQARIIEAVSDMSNINPSLEVLLFSIYCVALVSIDEIQCYAMFSMAKADLLKTYQFGCQQALINCRILRSRELDCLTGFVLYLISIRSDAGPPAVCCMLGVAVRLAQRMGIHNESANGKCDPLEAELRRRVWWALAMYDTRICEMSDLKSTVMDPTWDCKPVLNVNEFELRPEMKTLPVVHGGPTDSIYAVVRSEISDFSRHSALHLDFTNPLLIHIAKDPGEVRSLEKSIEDKYLRFCNPEIPLHYLTLWWARGNFAKMRLMDHYSKYSKPDTQQTDVQRDAAASYAARLLECDTMIMSSSLTKGFHWLADYYFPFPAYIHLVTDLRNRPLQANADKYWEIMSNNYDVRDIKIVDLFAKLFAGPILQAWHALKVAMRSKQGLMPHPPPIVSSIMQRVAKQKLDTAAESSVCDALSVATPMDVSGWPNSETVDFGGGADLADQNTMDFDLSGLDWSTEDWNPITASGGWMMMKP